MLVGNDIRTDARVKKSAVSLRRHGYRVTVVGRSAGAAVERATMAGVDVLRVPVQWVHRTRTTADMRRPSRWWRTERAARAAARSLADRELVVRAWQGGVVRDGGPVARTAAAAGAAVAVGGLRLAREGARVHRGLVRRVERRRPLERRYDWHDWAPAALDYRDQMVAAVVDLAPDVVHAHDVNMLAVADAVVSLAALEGRRVPLVYDAHELVAGISTYQGRTVEERSGWLSLERHVAPRIDRWVTVSPALADELVRTYRPTHPPVVTVNAPWARAQNPGPTGGVRAELGLDEDVPLLVYSGGLTEARGVDTVLEALPELPGVHLAVVPTPPGGHHLGELLERAEMLGVLDRFHVAAPVAPDDVVANLASADLGLIPLKRFPSHDVALTNKLFEYLHAGLPVVVSDCPVQAAFVTEHGIGTVHVAGDPASAAEAVRDALARRDALRAAVRDGDLVTTWSWQESERRLAELYAELLPGRADTVDTSPELPSLREDTDAAVVRTFRVAGEVPAPVAEALGHALTPTDGDADLVVVGVDGPGGLRHDGWELDVEKAVLEDRPVVLVAAGPRLARPWRAGGPVARRLTDVADLATLRTLDVGVLVTAPDVAARLPAAVLLTGDAAADADAVVRAVHDAGGRLPGGDAA